MKLAQEFWEMCYQMNGQVNITKILIYTKTVEFGNANLKNSNRVQRFFLHFHENLNTPFSFFE